MKAIYIGFFIAMLFVYGVVSQYEPDREKTSYHQMMKGK
jgi:uncharacterized membrane protein YccC